MRVNIGMPVVRTDGRSVYGHVITKFSRMGSLLRFLTHGAPQARFARQSSAITSHIETSEYILLGFVPSSSFEFPIYRRTN